MELKEIIYRIIGGGITPVGDEAVDEGVLERLLDLIDLLNEFNEDIELIAENYENSQLSSERAVGLVARNYVNQVYRDENKK